MRTSLTPRLRSSHPGVAGVVLFVLLTIVVAAPTVVAVDDSSTDDDTMPSLSEIDTYDALAIVFIVVGMAVSASGVIMVPAMVLIMGFDIKRATPISNVGILGGALANAWFNMQKRHPSADRPLIDADLALGMIPVVIGGARSSTSCCRATSYRCYSSWCWLPAERG